MGAIVRTSAAGLGLLVAYAVAPIPKNTHLSLSTGVVFGVGLTVLAGSVLAIARRELRAQAGDQGARIEVLALVLYTVLIFFASAYLRLAQSPGQFSGLRTRLDALYFTMTTLTTVGYGDVYAVGQAARLAVTAQLFFDVIFVATAVRVAGSVFQRLRHPPGAPPAGKGGPP